jgi:hypothetical protein
MLLVLQCISHEKSYVACHSVSVVTKLPTGSSARIRRPIGVHTSRQNGSVPSRYTLVANDRRAWHRPSHLRSRGYGDIDCWQLHLVCFRVIWKTDSPQRQGIDALSALNYLRIVVQKYSSSSITWRLIGSVSAVAPSASIGKLWRHDASQGAYTRCFCSFRCAATRFQTSVLCCKHMAKWTPFFVACSQRNVL